MPRPNCCNQNDREPLAMCFTAAGGGAPVSISALPSFDKEGNLVDVVYVGPIGPNGEVGTITLDTFMGGGTATLGACPLPSGALLVEGCITDANGDIIQGVAGVSQADGSLLWGPVDIGDYGFVDCCPEVENVQACILMEAFDYYSEGDWQVGDTSSFDVGLDGVSQGVLALDYLTETDGVNKSSWYSQLTALVNSVAGWSMAVDTDAPVGTSQRPIWQMDFNGVGPSSLTIQYNNDLYTMSVDAAGVMTTSATDSGNPMGTGKFTACA